MRFVKLQKQEGFTLIEVILAIALLGIVSVALISTFSYALIGTYQSGIRTKTLYQVQAKIENDEIVNPTKEQLKIKFGSKEVEVDIQSFQAELEDPQTGEEIVIHFFKGDK